MSQQSQGHCQEDLTSSCEVETAVLIEWLSCGKFRPNSDLIPAMSDRYDMTSTGSISTNAVKRIGGFGLAGFGLLLGFLCLGRAAETALDSNPNRTDRRETITASLLLGLPCTAGSLWMIGALRRQQQLSHSRRLQAIFYKALKANEGQINPLQFAVLGQISVDEAKDCLDAWAQQLNADFKIDEAGVVIYCFGVPAPLQRPDADLTFED